MQRLVIGGTYEHFKNSLVRVVGVALHSETLEVLVIYEKLEDYNGYKKGQLFARPKGMFLERIERNGKRMFRFVLIKK